jgi:transposase
VQEEAVAGARTRAIGNLSASPLGEPATRGSAAVAGSAEPDDCRLTQAIEREVEKSPQARLLMTHPGVGSLTALAFVLIIGKAERFQCGKQISCFLGLVPLEDSSGERRRLGHITRG